MAKEEIIQACVRFGSSWRSELPVTTSNSPPEDASRTDPAYLAEVVAAVIEAGARTVNIPDTVGYTVPGEFADLFTLPERARAGRGDIVLSVHCHNDLGMAVANSLAAVKGRCAADRMHDQRHRRTGRKLFARRSRHGAEDARRYLRLIKTAIDTRKLYPTSRLVSSDYRHARAAQQGDRRRERLRT